MVGYIFRPLLHKRSLVSLVADILCYFVVKKSVLREGKYYFSPHSFTSLDIRIAQKLGPHIVQNSLPSASAP